MSTNRFYVDLQTGKNVEETTTRLMQQVISLTNQLNTAKVPIAVGPLDSLPENPSVGQTIIDYSSGNSVVKSWNGNAFV